MPAALSAIRGSLAAAPVPRVLEEALAANALNALADDPPAGLATLSPESGKWQPRGKTTPKSNSGSFAPMHGAKAHTPEEERRIAAYKAATDQRVVDFVERCLKLTDGDEISKQRCFLCKTTPEFAERVKELTGIDTTGWAVELRGERVKHLDIRHGGQGKHDQSLADINDIGRIGYVMQHFDSLDYLRDKHGNRVFSDQYIDKNAKPSPVLETRMKIDGTYAIQEAVPDAKWRKIYIMSARIEKSKEP